MISPKISELAKNRIQATFLKAPLHFEANQGQTDEQVKFLARGAGYQMFLTATEAVIVLRKADEKQSAISRQRSGKQGFINSKPETQNSEPHSVLRMKLVGANPEPKVAGMETLPGKVNYFIGNDAKKWRTNIPTYERVEYKDVYPGVNLVYYGNQRQLEYDFVVSPGADPKNIKLAFEGADKVEREGSDLVISTASGSLRMHKPLVYQEVAGVKKEISAAFVLNPKSEIENLTSEVANPKSEIKNPKFASVGFHVASYDRSRPLVIDPILSYSTYLGGSGLDRGFAIAADASGNAYVTGMTNSTNFPTANPFQAMFQGTTGPLDAFGDAFVTKLDSAGLVVYSTYLGGSGNDQGLGIAVDTSGNAYVTGLTNSPKFPTTAGSFRTVLSGPDDAFVVKLNPAGNALVYSTYLGGNDSDGGFGIAVDCLGSAYVTGYTDSSNFPTVNPFQATLLGFRNTFVTKLNPTGNALVYSTYLGGSTSGGSGDRGFAIAVDCSGNAYVTGTANSTNFPVTVGAFQTTYGGGEEDAFVTKINPAGDLVYSTYLGGSGVDDGIGIAVDAAGNAYVAGRTLSSNFPTANPIQATYGGHEDGFVAKLNSEGSALVYSTYLGGSDIDGASSIAVDAFGNAYVTGTTMSTNFPLRNPNQATFGGRGNVYGDAFISKLNSAGDDFVYSTYLGGSDNDVGQGIALDASGNAYVAGITRSTNFPVANALFATYRGGIDDAFVAKIACSPITVAAISAPVAPVQVNTQITTSAAFTDPDVLDTHTAIWNWGDGTTSTGTVTETNGSGSVSGSHLYTAAGVYTVTLTVTGNDSCSGQSVFQFVVVFDPNAGFVTGGGWINSPAGAYTANPSLTGKANFGFVSRYRPGATVPEGQTEFRFSVANLNFHSSNYEWLVVGGPRAQYKGTGTINGSGSYNFILTAIDGQVAGGGGVDKFRIKIWSSGGVIYDNQMGASDTAVPTTQLGGGSIVIHTQ